MASTAARSATVPSLTPARRWVVDARARQMIGAAAVLGAVFVGLALLLRESGGTSIDISITRAVQRLQDPTFSALMLAVSAPGYWPGSLVVIGVTSLGFLLTRRYPEALFVVLTEGAGLLTAEVKLLVERPRPAGESIRIVTAALDYSFPSGHVVGYVSLYGFLFFLVYIFYRPSLVRTAALVFLGGLVGLIGLSRIHLGHHWVSDVMGGYALGTAYLLLLIVAYRLLVSRPAAEVAGAARGLATDPGTPSAFRRSQIDGRAAP